MEWQTLTYKPLYVLLADHLEAKIRSGDFGKDAYLPPMRRLMRLFNVSLATVRGALDRLEEQGLIERKHGSGVRVLYDAPSHVPDPTDPNLDIAREVEELFSLRAVLEPAALLEAFENLDREELERSLGQADPDSRDDLYNMDQGLHAQIITHCPNRYLQRALADTMKRIELYREIKFRNLDTATDRDFASVRAIVKAVLRNDADKAIHQLRRHIAVTRDVLLEHVRAQRSGDQS